MTEAMQPQAILPSTDVIVGGEAFVDRRKQAPEGDAPARERRQFANSYDDLSPAAGELARAIDQYKLAHRRRFITYEEMLTVIQALGYRK